MSEKTEEEHCERITKKEQIDSFLKGNAKV